MIRHYVLLDNIKETIVELSTKNIGTAEMLALEAYPLYHHAQCVRYVDLNTTKYKMEAALEAYKFVKTHEADERIIRKAKAQYKVLEWQWIIELTEKTANTEVLAENKKYLRKWQVRLAQCQ